MQQQNVESALPGTEPESIRTKRPNCNECCSTFRAVTGWEVFVTKLHRGGAEQYARKVVQPFHCKNFNIRTVEHMLKRVTSCSEPVREEYSQVRGNK